MLSGGGSRPPQTPASRRPTRPGPPQLCAGSTARSRAPPEAPASTSSTAEHSAEPSNGEPDAKDASAPSNADTDVTEPAWTTSKERKPGPDKGSSPTT